MIIEEVVSKPRVSSSIDNNVPYELMYPNLTIEDEEILQSNQSKYIFLHQTWKNLCIPSKNVPFVKQWTQVDKDLVQIFWTDKSMDLWVRKHFLNGSKVLQVWDLFTYGVKRADLFRYILMYVLGGLYMDCDVKPLKSWRPLLNKYSAIVAWEPDWAMKRDGWKEGEPKTYLLIGVLAAAEPGHPFYHFLLNYALDWVLRVQDVCDEKGKIFLYDCNPIAITGPIVAAKAYHEYVKKYNDSSLVVLENYLINSDCKECWANHIGSCTWCGKTFTCQNISSFVPDRLIIMPE